MRRDHSFKAFTMILALITGSAGAATFTVDDDSGDPDVSIGDGVCLTAGSGCTLKAAIQEANALPGADVIEVPTSLGGVPTSYVAEDELITDAVVLRGLGPDRVVIEGVPAKRLFTIDPPNAGGFVDIQLEALELRDGAPSGTGTQRGGIVYVDTGQGRIRIVDCRLTGGSADEGGAMFVTGGLNTVSIEDSEIWSSFASLAGGGIYVNGGKVVLRRSDVASNETAIDGGGLFLRSISFPTVYALDTTFRNNRADASGGAISVEQGVNLPRLTLERSILTGNQAGDGGGLDARGGRVTIVDSAIDGNQAVDLGGGGTQTGGGLRVIGTGGGGTLVPIVTVRGSVLTSNVASSGGGLLVANGVLSMADSTVSGNDADVSGGGVFAGFFGLARLANVTITDNEAAPGNTMAGDGGGVFISGAVLESRNSLIAGNEARLSGTGGSVLEDADCDGTFTSQGYNMIGTTEGCTVAGDTTGNLTNFTLSLAGLGALADNGGGTATHSIGSSSLAVDAGNPAGCVWDDDGDNGTPPVIVSTDQRGFVRTDSRCDVGAFERDGFAPDPIFSDAFESGDTWGWSGTTGGS